MPPENSQPGRPEDWLRRAGSDLALAKVGRKPGVLLEELCFHTQQAAEKAIKAVLISRGSRPGRTHNIGILLELMPEDIKVPVGVRQAAILTDYAVSTRYPGIYEPIEVREYREAIRLAGVVVEWATTIIRKPPPTGDSDSE